MHKKLDDHTFGQIARGEINPGRDLLPPELANLACDTTDMRDNLWLLYALTMGLTRPTAGAPLQRRDINVLEIGVSDGTSTLAFLKAAYDSGMGHVTSIDVADVPVAKALIGLFEMHDRWTFMHGDSKEMLSRLGGHYDVILVDGDHTYEGAQRDFLRAEDLLARGGFLLLHDSHLSAVDHDWTKPMGERGRPGCGVFAMDLLYMKHLSGFVLPFGYNLAIFRRASDSVNELRLSIMAAQEKGLLP